MRKNKKRAARLSIFGTEVQERSHRSPYLRLSSSNLPYVCIPVTCGNGIGGAPLLLCLYGRDSREMLGYRYLSKLRTVHQAQNYPTLHKETNVLLRTYWCS